MNTKKPKMTSDYKVGGGWGDAINWFQRDQFDKQPLHPESRYTVVGWKSVRPKVGQTLMGEFQNSWMKFKFVSVDLKSDPPDMFFAEVVPIEQEMKP